MKEELIKGLTNEQVARVKACKNTEELVALAKSEGIELTDEQLEAVSGGGCFSSIKCPNCGSKDHDSTENYVQGGVKQKFYICRRCGTKWL